MQTNKPDMPIYLDYAATTPVDPQVIEVMLSCLGADGCYGNPASTSHVIGRMARERVEAARTEIATLVGAGPEEIVFTSGATESDNLALSGVLSRAGPGVHLVTNRIEHKAVIDTARVLEARGYPLTWLAPGPDGRISPEVLIEAIRPDTVLVSIMHVNNEIGVIQDIATLGGICRERGVLFHVDAAQSVGKVPIDLSTLPVDLMSFSGHKVYGPKGIGALFVRDAPEVNLDALIHGGGHERGLRSGTLATHQIVGMGRAFALAAKYFERDVIHAHRLSRRLTQGLKRLGGVRINGPDEAHRSRFILNVSFDAVVADSLLYFLTDVAVSTGSACSSASHEPSYVLKALGYDDIRARGSLRLSLGRFTTEDEIDRAVEHIGAAVSRLRALAPDELKVARR